jgi:glycosyltransferase involved in cell wall biosynthesis
VSVSLIIATFNHARFLGEALDSAIAQTLKGLEIVVVDDGSTDDTPAVLARYAGRIRIVRQPNRGLAAARNMGLATARGTYVGFLDADDVLMPTKLAEQAAVLDRAPAVGWTYCDVLIETVATGAVTRASERFGYSARMLEGWLFPELIHGNFIPAIAPLVRRTVLDAAGGFDERLTALEDWDLWLRLSLISEARYSPVVLVRYRVHPGGMSEDRARMDRNRFCVLDKLSRTRPAAVEGLGAAGRRLIADTHNWFGKEAYARGDWAEARRRFAASLVTVPWQRQAPMLLGLSLVRSGTRPRTSEPSPGPR